MNYKALCHIQESPYSYALDERTVELRLRVDKDDRFEEIRVVYGNKYDYHIRRKTALLVKAFTDRNYDWYVCTLRLDDVRLVYVFELKCDGSVFYFSEDGLSDTYDFSLSYYNSFQLPYINAIDVQKGVEWFKNAVFYEIFVDRFYCGKSEKSRRYINLKWGEIPNPKSFAGGDLYGVCEKLDYLSSLGVNALYLTPVFKSVSNHKYDIYDYYDIDEQFGGKEALRQLVNKAHEKGMKIILDAVFNHCSDQTEQFQDVLRNGRNSKYFDWFIIRGDRVEKGNFECFSICDYMPKWNTSNREVRDYLIGIGRYWIDEFGIDGWRLDVADEVSHDFWRHFRESIKADKPDCLILGENWHDSYSFLNGGQFDGIMNYALTKALLDYLVNGVYGAQGFAEKLSELYMRNTRTVNSQMLNLLDSHDTHRFYTLSGKNKDKLAIGLAILYMHTGAPCLYYGTEIPLEGGYDPDCRRTMNWLEKGEMVGLLKALAHLREKDAVKDGTISFASKGELFLLERKKETVLRLTVNATDCPVSVRPEGKVIAGRHFDGALLGTGFFIEEIV